MFDLIAVMYYDGDTDTFTDIPPNVELGEN